MQSDLIRDRSTAKQILAFDGLEWGKIRPTDIDLSLDFKQKLFIFGELKGKHGKLTVGQRIHLEGLVKGLRAGGKDAVAFWARHDTPDTELDVHVAEAKVVGSFNGTQWDYFDSMTVKDYINGVRDFHNV